MTLPQQPAAPQPQSQHFLLKWNNHRSNMVSVFESLLQSENLVDVTLAVEGKFLKGHKIVLSACSPYFESMFVNQTPGEKHPILIFHDMKFSHLKTLLDFMYRGEISIDEKDLSDVLKVAEALSIRGLSSFESDDEEGPDNKSSEQNGNDSQVPNSNNSAGSTNNSPGYGYNATSGSNTNNNSSSSNNGASINNNESNNNQAQNQSDNHCISGNKNCDSSVNGSTSDRSSSTNNNNNTTSKTSSSTTTTSSSTSSKHQGRGATSMRNQKRGNYASPPPQPPSPPPAGVKRRRGRQPVRKDITPSPSRASSFKQAAAERKFQPTCPAVKPSISSSRQRVRRRMPRQFPSNMNPGRIKQEKHSDTEETGSGAVSGTTTPDDDEMDTDFLGSDIDGASGIIPSDICNSEPLSEMSVRGLDLFKYASVENGVYRCIECEKLCIPKTFKNKYSFQRHAFLYHEGNMRKVFPCPVCSREFSRPDKMKNHLRSIHEGGKGVRHNNGSSSNDPTGHGGDSNDFNDKCDV